MIKCPNCGSTAQIELIDTWYHEDGPTIVVERLYHCGCGRDFTTLQIYRSDDIEEIDNPCM